jgi:hypothetical protein
MKNTKKLTASEEAKRTLNMELKEFQTTEEMADFIISGYYYRDHIMLQYLLDNSTRLYPEGIEIDPLRCDILDMIGNDIDNLPEGWSLNQIVHKGLMKDKLRKDNAKKEKAST